MDGFLQDLKLRGFSKSTIEAYSFHNVKFKKFINKDPKFVTTKDIKEYISHLIDSGCKPKTINLAISALKSYYDLHRGRRLFSKIRRVKIEKKIPNVLSKDEIKRMISSTKNEKHKLMIKFLYSTGVRVGELINVKTEDLDLENGYVRIISGKGKKDRLTIISGQLCAELRRYLEGKGKGFLFESSRNKKLTERAVQEMIKKSSGKAGIQRRTYPHVLRASFASHLYDHGTQLQKIQKLMGHSDYKTTLVYVKSATVDISDIENPLDRL